MKEILYIIKYQSPTTMKWVECDITRINRYENTRLMNKHLENSPFKHKIVKSNA